MGKHCVEGMRRVEKRVEYLSSGLEPLRGGYREGVGGGDRERILTVTHLLFRLSFIFGTSTCHSMKSYNVKKMTF